jgi:hypothetical protein
MQTAAKLNVVVRYEDQRREGPNGRKVRLSNISIRVGDMVIARRVIPGTWSQRAALVEFRRFPGTFTRTEEAAALDLKACATLAAA